MFFSGCNIGKSLHNRICKFEFILSVAICNKILNITHNLSKFLQSVNLDIIKAYDHIHVVIDMLSTMRTNAEEELFLIYTETINMVTAYGIEPQLPRRVGTQKYRLNLQAADPKDYYRAVLFIPYLDEVIASMKDRFTGHESVVKNVYNIVPSQVVNVPSEEFNNIIEFYKIDLQDQTNVILAEIDIWKHYWKNKTERPSNPLEAIQDCNKELFPNIYMFLHLLIVIPVTTASAERSFSTLKRVKTYLRNSMGEDRLGALALASVYREKVEPDKIIDTFIKKNRRINF